MSYWAALVSIVWLAACDSSSPVEPEPAIEQRPLVLMSLAPTQATITVGETLRLTASIQQGEGPAAHPDEVIWFSTNEAVATVEAGGLVRGVGEGEAEIVALWGEARGVARLTVVQGTKQDGTTPRA